MSEVFLFGSPVAHSLSPAMHNAAFKALGMPHRYATREVSPDRLTDAVTLLRTADVLGANVTIPHKESAVRLVDDATDEVRAMGALNTIVRRGSRLAGANTDVAGFEAALAADGRDLLSGEAVLLLGAGGAARACAYALLRRRNEVLVANRSSERLEALVRTIEVDAVVNATPLGLHGED